MNLNKIKLTLIEDSLFVGKIDDKDYFSKDYSSFVSNSRLGNINPKQDGSPDKFFNPSTKFFSDSLILGSACHVKVLQDELFDLVQIDRPNAKLGFVCDYIWDYNKSHELSDEAIKFASDTVGYYKDKLSPKVLKGIQEAYFKYYHSRINIKEKENVETMYLSPKIYETATNCIRACHENKQFQKLLKPEGLLEEPISENEQAFTVGIKCEFPDKEPII